MEGFDTPPPGLRATTSLLPPAPVLVVLATKAPSPGKRQRADRWKSLSPGRRTLSSAASVLELPTPVNSHLLQGDQHLCLFLTTQDTHSCSGSLRSPESGPLHAAVRLGLDHGEVESC